MQPKTAERIKLHDYQDLTVVRLKKSFSTRGENYFAGSIGTLRVNPPNFDEGLYFNPARENGDIIIRIWPSEFEVIVPPSPEYSLAYRKGATARLLGGTNPYAPDQTAGLSDPYNDWVAGYKDLNGTIQEFFLRIGGKAE